MAGEFKVPGPGAGSVVYVTIHGSGNSVWSTVGNAFEAFTSGNFANYDVALAEQGVSNLFVGDMPAAVPAGVYDIPARRQATGTPLQTDQIIGGGQVDWNGSKSVPLADLATSGMLARYLPPRLTRGEMVLNFPISLVSDADNKSPFTSGTVSGQIRKDGGAWGALQSGAFTEKGLGSYDLQALTSGDLNANAVSLYFTATSPAGGNAVPLRMSFLTQRVSGL